MRTATILICLLVAVALPAAEEALPEGVADPYGLGPRLALLDHLREAHAVTMPPGSSWETILARYQSLQARPDDSYEAAVERDRLQRLREAAGVAADSDLDEDALRQRLREQEAADQGAFGASTIPDLAAGVDRGGDDHAAHAAADPDTGFTPPPAAREFVRETVHGKLLTIRADDALSEDGVLGHRFVTGSFDVLGTDATKAFLPRVAAHAHAFRDAVLPIMRLPRRPSLDGANIAIVLFGDRDQYLRSSVRPHPATRGVCQILADREGVAVGVRVITWADDLAAVLPVLQHELVHALHAAALGRLTHSWYAEGMAAFFEDWDLTRSAQENLAERPRHLAALPYIRYQDSIDGVPDLQRFWETTWNSDSPFRYEIAEAFMDYLLRDNEDMLKRCHSRCLRQVPPHRYFDQREQRILNRGFQEHIRAAMQAAGVR